MKMYQHWYQVYLLVIQYSASAAYQPSHRLPWICEKAYDYYYDDDDDYDDNIDDDGDGDDDDDYDNTDDESEDYY